MDPITPEFNTNQNDPEPIANPISKSELLGWSCQTRCKYFVTGVVFPLLCFGFSLAGTSVGEGKWQSNRMEVYCGLLLEGSCFRMFLPLLLFSMVALGTCCVRPATISHFWTRMGILSGAILSIQFFILVVIATGPFSCLHALVVAPVLSVGVFVISKMVPKQTRISILQMLALTTVVAIALSLWKLFGLSFDVLLEASVVVIMCILVSAPTLACVTYVRSSADILSLVEQTGTKSELRLMAFVAPLSWFLTWLASWRMALDAMIKEYAALPLTDPSNCYVSAAASHGHPNFVGVTQFANQYGVGNEAHGFALNSQMCRLKLLELMLACVAPRIHGWIRKHYDRVGPYFAKRCSCNRWFSDATFVLLKPLEWMSLFGGWLLGLRSADIAKIYTCRIRSVFDR